MTRSIYFTSLPGNKGRTLDFVLGVLHSQKPTDMAFSQRADWLAHEIGLPYPEALTEAHYQQALDIVIAETEIARAQQNQ